MTLGAILTWIIRNRLALTRGTYKHENRVISRFSTSILSPNIFQNFPFFFTHMLESIVFLLDSHMLLYAPRPASLRDTS